MVMTGFDKQTVLKKHENYAIKASADNSKTASNADASPWSNTSYTIVLSAPMLKLTDFALLVVYSNWNADC